MAKAKSCKPGLVTLAAKGDLAGVRRLLKTGAAVEARERVEGLFEGSIHQDRAVTALCAAAAKGQLPVVKVLLDAGASVDGGDALGDRPLHHALRGGRSAGTRTKAHDDVVSALIAAGSCTNSTGDKDTPPISIPASAGDVAAVRVLLAAGASPLPAMARVGKGEIGAVLFDAAAASGERSPLLSRVEAARAALNKAGILRRQESSVDLARKIYVGDPGGSIPYVFPEDLRSTSHALALLDATRTWFEPRLSDRLPFKDVRTNRLYGQCLQAWAKRSEGAFPIEGAEEAWSDPYELSISVSLAGTTHALRPRIVPSRWFDPGIVLAVNRLATGERRLRVGDFERPGMLFVWLTNTETALLESECGWRFLDENQLRYYRTGMTGEATAGELVLAAHANDPDRVRELLAQGVAPDAEATVPDLTRGWPATSELPWTALESAAFHWNLPMVQSLLDAGASPNFRSEGGRPPLFIAAIRSDVVLTRLLVSRGADVRAIWNQLTPLHWAARSESADAEQVVRILLEAGADPRAVDDLGRKPLAEAKSPAVKELLTRATEAFSAPEKDVAWLASYVTLLQKLGFLTELATLSPPEAVFREVEKRVEARFHAGLDPKRSEMHWMIAALDGSRVWIQPFHPDDTPNMPDAGVYAQCVRDWAAISRGLFQPTAVKEKWSRDCNVEVSFRWDGELHKVRFYGYKRNCFDAVTLVWPLNALLAKESAKTKGNRFVVYDHGTVLMLTPKEEAELRAFEPRWTFSGDKEYKAVQRGREEDDREWKEMEAD